MREVKNKHQFDHCLNCEAALQEEDSFCHRCGQKRVTGRVSFWDIVKEFIDSIFSFDARLLRSIITLFTPGKLTQEYFKGKHVSYWQPLRLFSFLAVLQIAAFSYSASKLNEKVQKSNDSLRKSLDAYLVIQELDSLKPLVAQQFVNKKLATSAMDTLLKSYSNPEVLKGKQKIVLDSIRALVIEELKEDSVAINDENINKAMQENLKESKSYNTFGGISDTKSDSIRLPSFGTRKDGKHAFWGTDQLSVSKKDFIGLSEDELLKKYNVEGFWAKTLLKQSIKIMKNGRGVVSYFMDKLSFMIILMMPFLAFFLEIANRKYYYVEHLIFSFHCHCMLFLMLSSATFIDVWLGSQIGFFKHAIGPIMFYLLLYFYWALRRIYQQGRFKTLVKFTFLLFSYSFTLLISFLLMIIVSFLFF